MIKLSPVHDAPLPPSTAQADVSKRRQAEFEQAMQERKLAPLPKEPVSDQQQRVMRAPEHPNSRRETAQRNAREAIERERRLTQERAKRTSEQPLTKPVNDKPEPPPPQVSTPTPEANRPASQKDKGKPGEKEKDPGKNNVEGKGKVPAAQVAIEPAEENLKLLTPVDPDSPHHGAEEEHLILIEPEAAFASNPTPGDRLLARLQAAAEPLPIKHELNQLLESLQARIQAQSTTDTSAALLHLNLPTLGSVEIQLATSRGLLQVDIQASAGCLQHLQRARLELQERLQRLNPGQDVQLSFGNPSGSDQGSRQRRSVYEEWDPKQ